MLAGAAVLLTVIDLQHKLLPNRVVLPTLGGSLPYSVFSQDLKTPTVGLSIANFDNNQHEENENLRLGAFFDAIVTIAAVLRM